MIAGLLVAAAALSPLPNVARVRLPAPRMALGTVADAVGTLPGAMTVSEAVSYRIESMLVVAPMAVAMVATRSSCSSAARFAASLPR